MRERSTTAAAAGVALAAGEPALDVEIAAPEALPLSPAECERAARVALVAAGVLDGHLAIAFVAAERIRELNAAHRGIEHATDVLSFPVDGPGPAAGPRELGDVIVCPARAADLEEAIVHGVLHLCGYDHERDAGEMLGLQDRVLRALRG